MKLVQRISWVALFAVAMALVEACVVVYLRRTYYPEGFTFPLHPTESAAVAAEIGREIATLIMLLAVGILAGKSRRERLAYAGLAFGIWDLFYYLWLKLLIGWPASLFDWDVLFLIPWPWIGPVIAPCAIAVVLIVLCLLVLLSEARGQSFKLSVRGWLLIVFGTLVLLFSFLRDLDASLHFRAPQPYWYPLLVLGLACYILAFLKRLSF